MLESSLVFNQSLQILDHIVELGHLEVVLNDVGRIEEPNRFNVLLDCFVKLFLRKKLIGVLFYYFRLDVFGEVGVARNCLCFLVETTLHQVVNLDIVLHFVELDKFSFAATATLILRQVVNGIIFDLNVHDLTAGCRPEQRNLILEIVYVKLTLRGSVQMRSCAAFSHWFHLNNVIFEETHVLFLTVQSLHML